MDTISDNLIHFLGRNHIQSPIKQFEIFVSILEKGLRASPIRVSFPSSGVIYNNVVCFTDLPLKFCDRHTSLYGKFGIGFKKSYIKNVGGNPAMYFVDHAPMGTIDGTFIETRGVAGYNFGIIQKFALEISNHLATNKQISLVTEDGEILSNEVLREFKEACIYSLSFLKEIGDLGKASDESKEIDPYYKEREWRLVPAKLNEINKTGTLIKKENNFYFGFKRSHVNCVIVPNIDMRKQVNQYFNSLSESENLNLKEFSEDPPPVFVYDDLKKW